jgi:hypothetical protein
MAAAEGRKDFFVSYTGVDRQWAEWIACVLEEAGHTVVLQAWDFRPGSAAGNTAQCAAFPSRCCCSRRAFSDFITRSSARFSANAFACASNALL